jgi:hypothetical protein
MEILKYRNIKINIQFVTFHTGKNINFIIVHIKKLKIIFIR